MKDLFKFYLGASVGATLTLFSVCFGAMAVANHFEKESKKNKALEEKAINYALNEIKAYMEQNDIPAEKIESSIKMIEDLDNMGKLRLILGIYDMIKSGKHEINDLMDYLTNLSNVSEKYSTDWFVEDKEYIMETAKGTFSCFSALKAEANNENIKNN